MHVRIPLLALALATSAACGWFAKPPSQPAGEDEDPAASLPKCRPASATVKRGEPPWSAGMTTAGGWTVGSITFQETKSPSHYPEYVRVAFAKDGVETGIEVSYSDAGAGDWSTAHYRLMPAPDQEPPQALLLECIETLRTWDASHADTLFVKKRVGTADPYAGLPPCKADGTPP